MTLTIDLHWLSMYSGHYITSFSCCETIYGNILSKLLNGLYNDLWIDYTVSLGLGHWRWEFIHSESTDMHSPSYLKPIEEYAPKRRLHDAIPLNGFYSGPTPHLMLKCVCGAMGAPHVLFQHSIDTAIALLIEGSAGSLRFPHHPSLVIHQSPDMKVTYCGHGNERHMRLQHI